MMYLKEIVAIVEDEGCFKELEQLRGTLPVQGIELKQWQGTLQSEGIELKLLQCATQSEGAVPEHEAIGKHRLWMTDSAECAVLLREQGGAVLAWLHEGNRNENFTNIPYACERPAELDAHYFEGVYRRYAGIPWDVTETDRCEIRETVEEDAAALLAIYENPQMTRYTEGLHATIEQEKQYIRDYREKVYGFYGFGIWTIIEKPTQEIIGRAGFSYREGFEVPELGFAIGVPWQRQGYGEEVCRALLQYARDVLAFEEVQTLVMPENISSIKLCHKLGFKEWGSVRIEGFEYIRFVKGL